MELIEAIRARKSIRAFKPDPVPLDLMRKIIGEALHAPSWANTQPWEFAVAAGARLKAIQDAFVARGVKDPQSEVARPYDFPEPMMGRIRALQTKERGERSQADIENMFFNNFRHYGAPCCIYLLIQKNYVYQTKGVNVWGLYDCGSVVENIMLLASGHGLGTIAQAQAVVYPDIIRQELGIPADKLIALGIAIGYEDKSSPINKEVRVKEPLDKVAKFYGF